MTSPKQLEANRAAEPLFPVGSRVLLKYSPSDEVGHVARHEHGRVVVLWPLWDREGRYMPSSLIIAGDKRTSGWPDGRKL